MISIAYTLKEKLFCAATVADRMTHPFTLRGPKCADYTGMESE